jgi:hypothetical protein
MQILDVPMFYKDMVHSVSLTGVTTLKESRYKQRHGGSKNIVQIPGKGFDEARFHRVKPKRRFSSRKAKQKTLPVPKGAQGGSERKSTYRIDKTEVTHRIRGYINQMKGEKLLYFWTITFPINTTDDTAYKLLNKWLTRLRQERLLRDYLWIAERQQNKTIHFHLVLNQRMDVKKANRYMRAAIMTSIDKKEIEWTRNQATNYNGVDICKDRKTRRVTNFAKQNKQKSLTNYLTKYVTKNNESFPHLAWHSSRGYSNLILSVRFTNEEYSISNCGELLMTENPIESEWFIHYRWKGEPPKDLLNYLAHINQIIQHKLNSTS